MQPWIFSPMHLSWMRGVYTYPWGVRRRDDAMSQEEPQDNKVCSIYP